MRKLFIITIISAILFSVNVHYAQIDKVNSPNCFTILAGKNTTVDGSVLLAHNEDDGGEIFVDCYKVPAAFHESTEYITLKNGHQIKQAERTFGFLWLEMPGQQFSDSYMNEWGVAIVSNGCPSVETEEEIVNGGIGYYLRKIMAERAKSAREAVIIAGKLIEDVGYSSSGRSYCIADPNEAWVLAVVKGKHWVAQRIPDDEVAIIPNYYTIDKINLKDTLNFLGSADIIDYAVKRGWFDPATNKNFNFRLSYSAPRDLQAIWNIPRHWQSINLLSEKQFSYYDKLPFSFIPQKKLSIQDIMVVLQNHYEGTQFEMNHEYNNGNPHKNVIMRICAETTQYGLIAQLRNWLPVDIGAVLWLAPRRPCIQPFIPWYLGINSIPVDYTRGDFKEALNTHFTITKNFKGTAPKHAFLAFTDYAHKIDADYENQIPTIRKLKKTYEKKVFENQADFESHALKIYKENPGRAKDLLTEYTTKLARETLEMTKERLK